MAAAGRGPVLGTGHSRGELARIAPGCDVAEADALRGCVAEQRLTFVAPNL